jgi:flagellar FliJ protein
MKRFSFRLESVRALREQAEEQAKAELGRELALEAALRGRVDDAVIRLRQAAVSGNGNGFDFAARQAYIERCERDIVAARHALAQGTMRVAQRRAQLAEAARERETLERLKNRHRDEHDAEGRRAEEAVLSEVGLSMFRSRTA